MAIRPSVQPEHPVLREHGTQRAANVQNRIDGKRQVLADNQWAIVQTEETQNEQLIELSTQILELTKAIHALTVAQAGAPGD